ncbi:MAG: hypothetical protein Q9168_007492 [Polycauliona sp. 1 TL-2023]
MSTVVLPAPPGGDVDLRAGYMAGIIVMTVVAVAIVWLRMYTRAFVSHNLGWDDWIMFVASLITILTNAFLINAYRLGLGRHLFYVPPYNIPETFKWLWAAEPTNLFAVFLVRLSIALFFLRLIPPKKRYLWTIWGVIGLLALSDIYVSINYFFECVPIRKVWLPDVPGSCAVRDSINESALWLFQCRSSYQAGFDHSLLHRGLTPRLELCVGMICGSVPSLRPLAVHWRKRTPKNSKFSSGAPVKMNSYHRRPLNENEGRGSQILRTEDVDVSFKNSTAPGKTDEAQKSGWNAV